MDWSVGSYEHTAAAIEPIAQTVVERLGIGPGDRVLDVACGTGNAALVAAAAGATVTGVDLAQRLLDVAAARAEAAGVASRTTWLAGDAQQLPVGDSEFDLAVSIFGVIFAPDPDAAARELVRAVRPGGRIVLTSWFEAGAIHASGRIVREAIERIVPPDPEAPPPTHWGIAVWVIDLFLRAGAGGVEICEEEHSFTGESPEAWLAEQEQNHPLWLGAVELLESAGAMDETRARSLENLREWNEDPAAFRVTSRYLIITATLGSG